MILGLSLPAFTTLHVVISLVAILAGLIALPALAAGRWLSRWQHFFLAMTALTTITGFLFPIVALTPALITGLVSTLILAVAYGALLGGRLKGRSRATYAITATIAFYLNAFVLVVQSFQKVPALNALAPTGSEPPFAIAQAAVLIGIFYLGYRTVRGARRALAI